MWHLRPWPWPTGTSPTPLTHPHKCLFALRLVLQSDKRPSPSDTFSGFKNKQFRQHFSTGRYCSVGEGASVADVEGKCTTIIFRDEIEFIARTHCRATPAHREKLGRRCELCIDATPMQLLSHWYEHKLSTFQLAAVASSWGIVGRKILQKGRTRDALGGRELANLDIVHFARNVSCGFGRVRIKTLG